MKDKYIEKKLKQLQGATTKKQEISLLNKIYEDGFSDGQDEMTQEEWEEKGHANDWGLLR